MIDINEILKIVAIVITIIIWIGIIIVVRNQTKLEQDNNGDPYGNNWETDFNSNGDFPKV